MPHTWSFLQHNSSDESIEIAGRGTYLNLIGLNIRYAKKHTANTTRKNTWAGFFVSGISQLASYNSDLKLTKKVIKLFRSFPLFSSVNGRWTLWSTWEDCSKTCGSGTKARRRSCSNPPPQHGGQACTGPSKQTKSCLLKDCPSKHRVFMFTNNVNIYNLRHNYSYSSDYRANFSSVARPYPSTISPFNFSVKRIESTKTLLAFDYIHTEKRNNQQSFYVQQFFTFQISLVQIWLFHKNLAVLNLVPRSFRVIITAWPWKVWVRDYADLARKPTVKANLINTIPYKWIIPSYVYN